MSKRKNEKKNKGKTCKNNKKGFMIHQRTTKNDDAEIYWWKEEIDIKENS